MKRLKMTHTKSARDRRRTKAITVRKNYRTSLRAPKPQTTNRSSGARPPAGAGRAPAKKKNKRRSAGAAATATAAKGGRVVTLQHTHKDCVAQISMLIGEFLTIKEAIISNEQAFANLNRNVTNLLLLERNEHIKAARSGQGYIVSTPTETADGEQALRATRMGGITKLIRACFWPYGEDEGAPFARKSSSTPAADQETLARQEMQRRKQEQVCETYYEVKKKLDRVQSSRKDASNTCPNAAGVEHGLEVHEQVAKFAATCLNGKNTADDRMAKAVDFVEDTKTNYFDMCTVRALQKLVELRCVPVRGEFLIWDEVLMRASGIDLLVTNVQGQLGTVELKTGYESQVYHPILNYVQAELPKDVQASRQRPLLVPTMEAPLDHLEDCLENRHKIQLMLYNTILRKRYLARIGAVLGFSYVLRVFPRESRSTYTEITASDEASCETLYQGLLEHVRQEQKERQQQKEQQKQRRRRHSQTKR